LNPLAAISFIIISACTIGTGTFALAQEAPEAAPKPDMKIERKADQKAIELDAVQVKGKRPDGTAEAGYRVGTVQNVGPWGERKLQDTPYSITSTSAEMIQNAQVQDPWQLFMMNPLTQAGYPTTVLEQNTPTIRGFVASTFVDGNQLYQNSSVGLEDKKRVEIISGAQSFLNDAASVGGSVNYIYKRPTRERLSEVTVGNHGGSQNYAQVDLGGPIDQAGRFGYRFNAVDQGGKINIDDQSLKHRLVTLALDWHVTDDLLIQPLYSYRYRHLDNPNAYWNGITDYSAFVPDPSKTYGEKYSFIDLKTNTYGAKLSWKANWISAPSS